MTPRDVVLTDAEPLAPRLRWSVVVQIVGWIAMALITYGMINARVAVVESKQGETERRLMRIEDKLDLLLRQGR